MKMLKKMLAVVLTGAMALTLLTACGSNAVTEKDIADAMNDMAKAAEEDITFTPRAKEREMAKAIAALLESETATATVADGDENSDSEFEKAAKNILGCNKGGANENNFVWFGWARTDKIGASGQAYQLLDQIRQADKAINGESLTSKKMEPKDTRHMGTALCKMREGDDEDSKLVTVRIIVVTAEPKG